LNLRPPGPQPTRCSISQWWRPVFTGFSPAGSPSVSLKLDPKLDREHMFDSVSGVVAVDERFGSVAYCRKASLGKMIDRALNGSEPLANCSSPRPNKPCGASQRSRPGYARAPPAQLYQRPLPRAFTSYGGDLQLPERAAVTIAKQSRRAWRHRFLRWQAVLPRTTSRECRGQRAGAPPMLPLPHRVYRSSP